MNTIPIDSSKTGLLPGSGINLNEYKSPLPVFENKTVFLMISRLIVEKGVSEYNEAARLVKKRHPNAEFRLLGKYEPDHKRKISNEEFEAMKTGEDVIYLEHTDDVKKEINEADVVVLPSYREGTPRTLLEAAAMSRPLITTDVAGCREVVDDGVNGFLCEAKNAQSLARKMELFLSLTNSEKAEMALASRKLVRSRFDESIVIAEYSRKIKQLLKH